MTAVVSMAAAPCHADFCADKVRADGWSCGYCLRWAGYPNWRLLFNPTADPSSGATEEAEK